MSFTLRVFFNGLIAFVVGEDGDPPPVTAYLVNGGSHHGFLLHASQQDQGNCTYDIAVDLFTELKLSPPQNTFRACRFHDFAEISIDSVGQELKYTDSGCQGCPSGSNRDWFCWVPRVAHVADESIKAKSEDQLIEKSSAAVRVTEGHLKTFALADYGKKIVLFKARVKGGVPESPFSQAAAELSFLELPVSSDSVTIKVAGANLVVSPSHGADEVDLVIGNLPPRQAVSSPKVYADHFAYFYELGRRPPNHKHLPYRALFDDCGLSAGINPNEPPLIKALREGARQRGEGETEIQPVVRSTRKAYEPPICPQARF